MAATFAYYEFSATQTTVERSLITNSTALTPSNRPGMLQVMVRGIGLAATDLFEVAVVERVVSSAASIHAGPWQLSASNDTLLISNIVVHNNWDVTVRKEAGTDRVIESACRLITA